MSEYQVGGEIEFRHSVEGYVGGCVIAGPFPTHEHQMYVCKGDGFADHYWVPSRDIRPKPKPPEYEYLDFAGHCMGEVNEFGLYRWQDEKESMSAAGHNCYRRIKNKPETIEWIPNAGDSE